MRRQDSLHVWVAAAVLALSASAAHAEDRLVERRTSVRVHFASSDAPSVEARYAAVVDVEHYQVGRHASRFHPFDDRQCRWSAVAYVQRDVCQIGASSAAGCDQTKSRRYPLAPVPASATEKAYASPNCAISRDSFAPQLTALRVRAAAALGGVATADQTWLKRDLEPAGMIVAFEPSEAPRQSGAQQGPGSSETAQSFAEATR